MRTLSPYELNQCQKYRIDPSKATKSDIPIEYLTGHVQFCQHDFLVNQNTLIPRIESEKIVQLSNLILKSNSQATVADIGTGSGCLGISLFLLQPQITLYLSDISPNCLSIAKKNAQNLIPRYSPNLHFLSSNLLTQYPAIKFDLIIANLPYIPTSNVYTLDSSVKNFEPNLALDGGPNGLSFINRLLRQAPQHLRSKGKIILEIDDSHKQDDFTIHQNTYHLKFTKDCFNKTRFLQLELKS